MNGAAALALWEGFVADVDLSPAALVGLVVPLNRVYVLACGVGNAAENVDGRLSERA